MSIEVTHPCHRNVAFCGGIPRGESSAHFKATAGFFLLPHLAEYLQRKKSKRMFPNRFILIFQVLDNVSFSKYKKNMWWFLFFALAGKEFTPAGNFPTCLRSKKGPFPSTIRRI